VGYWFLQIALGLLRTQIDSRALKMFLWSHLERRGSVCLRKRSLLSVSIVKEVVSLQIVGYLGDLLRGRVLVEGEVFLRVLLVFLHDLHDLLSE
jgi:hypothetical protein